MSFFYDVDQVEPATEGYNGGVYDMDNNSHTYNMSARNYDAQQSYPSQAAASLQYSSPSLDSINWLRLTICNLGVPDFGLIDTTSGGMDAVEVKKTVDCISALVRLRQQDIRSRLDQGDRFARHESDMEMLRQSNQRLQEKVHAVTNQLKQAENKYQHSSTQWLAEKKQLTLDKSELERQLSSLKQRDVHKTHELRKREADYKRLQEKLAQKAAAGAEKEPGKPALDLQEVLISLESASKGAGSIASLQGCSRAFSKWKADVLQAYESREQDLVQEIRCLTVKLKQAHLDLQVAKSTALSSMQEKFE